MNVRTLRTGEPIPEGFATGYEKMPVQEDWIWIAETDGIPVGLLMVAPCHGLIYLMRLCVKKGAHSTVAFFLLRGCMRECKRRGFKGFFTHIDPTGEIDRRVLQTCRKSGGLQMLMPQVMLVGSIERAARY